MPTLIILLVMPIIFETIYLWITKRSKWWYIVVLLLHRNDIAVFISHIN